MVSSISSWAQGIIIAIIVGSIIQMLLPENKNKKYIKLVIGVYILFYIINPVVGKQLNFNEFSLDEYLNVEAETNSEETNIYGNTVKETFKNKVIYNIRSQLNSKGYESNNIKVEIDDECNILKIVIKDVCENNKKSNNDEKNNEESQIVINKVDTNIDSVDIKEEKVKGMAIIDKNNLIDYLSENYQIDKKKMKEKLKNMFKGKKKTENLVVLIVILIVTVVAINYIWSDEKKDTDGKIKDDSNEKKTVGVVQVNNDLTQDDLEMKLENILKKISGVGDVKVMLTYSESSVLKPIYNEDSSVSNTNETDSSGGTRTVTETDSQREVVYKENNDGSKEPLTQSISSPKIEGAIIVASGAEDANVKSSIVQAVEAATGLATHKIQVFKMEEEIN